MMVRDRSNNQAASNCFFFGELVWTKRFGEQTSWMANLEAFR